MGARAALVVAVALLALTATAAGTVRVGPLGGAPSPAAAVLVTDQAVVPAGRTLVPLPGSYPIHLTLTLRFSNSTRLSDLLRNLEAPSSPEYRSFLDPSEFREQFAPTPAEVATAEAALLDAGAGSVSVTSDRLGVSAVLPADGVASLLGVRPVSYEDGLGRLAYTTIGTPRLSGSLGGIVAGVGGLSDAGNAAIQLASEMGAPRPIGQFVVENHTSVQWDVGSDFALALGATTLWPGAGSVANATFPTGIAIATLLASSYNSTSAVNLPPYDPAVVDAYFNDTLGPGWPAPTVKGIVVPLNGIASPPPPGKLDLTDSSEDEFENSLDIEMAGSLAPGSSVYDFYFAGSQMVAPLPASDVADDFALDLEAALNYNYAPDHLAVVSGSFGLPEVNDPLWNSELEEATVLGVTVVCASGDQGNAPNSLTGRGGAWPTWPASAAFDDAGAVSVGGTTVTLAGTPTSLATSTSIDPAYDPNVTGVANAVAWYENTTAGSYAGSEGGASSVFPEPSWQFHSAAQWAIVNATMRQGAGSLGRTGPDVAFPSNDTIAFVFANSTGTIFLDVLAGTSVAAPVFAGLLASVVAVESLRAGRFTPLGFLDPELYRIGSYYASPAVDHSAAESTDPYLDIVRGSNFVFAAGPGWDAVTGWGELTGPAFLAADLNATIGGFVYTGPTPGLPPRAAPFLSVQTEYLLIGIGTLVAIALVIIAARPTRAPARAGPTRPSTEEDLFGPPSAPLAARSGPTFVCPYCGGERPSEPVRCPHCGTL
ncbi:MAG: protease pro-enzyme activation domain-containing protein [Thermoplasmata archaeon]